MWDTSIRKSDKLETRLQRHIIERDQQWMEEIRDIPFIQFPADWKIQIIPPFNDAVVRFRVQLPSGKEKSIYLDTRSSLGVEDGPYWEVYPYQGDVGRCDRENVEELLKMIGDE